MATNPLQSAGIRFVQKFGVAFFWAIVVGLLFGGAAYFRVDRRELEGEPRWHVLPRLWLEQLEARTVDWRARELGASEERADGVVLVNVDEETLSNARESEHPEWAMRPWPRELLGAVTAQAIREGAAMVFIDESFADVSARQCAPCKGEDASTDDQRFAQTLKSLGDKVVLGFDWHSQPRRAADRPLMPLLLRVADVESEAQTFPWVQRVLLQRTSAYVIKREGRFVVWAGSSGEANTRQLMNALGLKGTSVLRSLEPADDAAEVTGELLLQKLAHVQVQGLDLQGVPHARALDAPVAALLMPEVTLASMKFIPDSDDVIRSVPLLINVARAATGNALVAGIALRSRPGVHSSYLVEGDLLKSDDQPSVPIDAQGFLTLRWNGDAVGRGGRGTMKRAVSAWKLLVNREDDEAGSSIRHHDNDLAGRVVVLIDERSSPLAQTPVGQLTRGAIWAQAISNVARGEGITRVPARLDFWLTVAFSFVGALLAVAWSSLVRRPGWLAWVATIGFVCGVHALLSRQFYVAEHRQVAMLTPVLACSVTFLAALGYARTLEHSLRDFMLRALGGAVRADIFHRVERDLALMRPERRELTVFFSDIEGFTSVSNDKEPTVVVEVLRDYLEEMTTLVLDRGGHVDKYLGDGMMAFWGAPISAPNDDGQACEAVLRMHERFNARRHEWEEKTGKKLLLRAGLERGTAVVGEMGTIHRVNYTVMGEPVAIAFRLESLAKRYGVRTLVGGALREEVEGQFLFRAVDTVRLGREGEPIKLYELLARTSEGAQFGWLHDFEIAHLAWEERRFGDALDAFNALAIARPDDAVVARYIARCAALIAAPPPATWNGIYDGD